MVGILDSVISFISGFMVFSIIGYLASVNSIVANNRSSYDLVFVAVPTANELLPASRFWTFIFFLMVFISGADYASQSVFSLVSVIYDDNYYRRKNYRREYYVVAIGIILFLLGLPFCTNMGNVYLDSVDHYLFAYLGYILIILQCLSVGWLF